MLRDSRGLDVYIAGSAKGKLRLAVSSNGCNRHQYIQLGTFLKTARPWGYESQPAHLSKSNKTKGCSHGGFSEFLYESIWSYFQG